MRIYQVVLLLVVAWAIWVAPFFLAQRRRTGGAPHTLDRRARWGIALQALSFALVWFRLWWIHQPSLLRVALGVAMLSVAILLSWTSSSTLGRQWRVDAGLNPDHQLVQAGAYRFVRHPIYCSMLALMLGAGLLLDRLSVLALATAFQVAGAQIRIRVEDRLLAARFGDVFAQYRRDVPAYLPFVR